MRPLSSYKRMALSFGNKLVPFTKFAEEAKLEKTEFSGGKYMEIVMAWMLGYYRASTGSFVDVKMSEELDKAGRDFQIRTYEMIAGIDMKFDKDVDEKALSNNSKQVICVYPTKKGHSSSGRTMTGEEALRRILSAVLYQSTIDNKLNGQIELLAVINEVWAHYSVGW